MKPERQYESGNALWFILLAVALLAALTATIASTSDTTEQSGDIERYRIHASTIMRHTAGIREAVNNMRTREVGESQLDFTSTGFLNSCPDCLVYGSAGGGASWQNPESAWLDSDHEGDADYGTWVFLGKNNVNGVNTGNSDLVMTISYLKPALCAQINAMLKISGEMPVDSDSFDTTAFSGSLSTTSGTISDDDAPDIMSGKKAACFYDDTGARGYTFYQVLVPR